MYGLMPFGALIPMSSKEWTRSYADIRMRLESSGRPIGPNDLWIAAQALSYGLVLVIANIDEFSRVPSLEIENWRA